MDSAPPKPKAATPRHAASLVVWRQRAGGVVEILMGLRGAGAKFMPNKLVFPGGRMDKADAKAAHASTLREDVLTLMGRHTKPRLAHALGIAAARELEEETGLSMGAPPALHTLDYLCRAVTPTTRPIRFNARFFAVPADATSGTLGGDGELHSLAWFPVPEIRSYTGIMLPQLLSITELERLLALSAEERAARASTPVFLRRKMRME